MVKFLPNFESLLWSLKCQTTFHTVDDMKANIVDFLNRVSSYMGHCKRYHPDEVEIHAFRDVDRLTGWKNYCRVVLDGFVIGYCGE